MQPKFRIDLEAFIPGSRYFKWKEALWLPLVQAYAVPSELQMDNIISQAKALDKVRDYFGHAIIVHSWLRPVEYNKIIGGAPQSRHTLGRATDFTVIGYTHEEVKKTLMANRDIYLGRGEIDTTNWVHLDLDPGPWFYARTRVG